jgi:hypothetical protein
VVIHEVFGADPRRTLKTQLMPVYCDGLDAYYETRFEAAYARFAQYLEAFPDDHVVREYAKRARYFILHGAPPNWEGTVRINEPFVPPHARRGFPRFRLPGTARIESGVDERQDGLDDISGSGVGIISEQRLGVGSLVPVTIRIHFRQDGRVVDETFRLKGSVKRITDKDAGRWEYGLEIVCIEPADERRLNETLYREESRAYRVR